MVLRRASHRTVWARFSPQVPGSGRCLGSSLQRLRFPTSLIPAAAIFRPSEAQCPSVPSAPPGAQFPKPFCPPLCPAPQPPSVQPQNPHWELRGPNPTLASRASPLAAQARSQPRPLWAGSTAAGQVPPPVSLATHNAAHKS